MQAEIRMPQQMREYPDDAIISNLTGLINQEIEQKIKGSDYFSRYSAWNFNGRIWWNDEIGYWCCEVWQYNNYVATYLADNLQDLAHEVDNKYGGGEKASFI